MSVLVGKKAPDFTAAAILPDNSIEENFTLSRYLGKKLGVVFFYPLDFTFVCPTEILAFDHRLKSFEKKGVKVVAVSVDSHFTHLAWKNTPVKQGGIGQVTFPMVADLTKSIARDYDVLINEAVALRGTFLIDENFVVRHQVVNDLPLGRNIDETLRMVDALQHFNTYGEVCPAGWAQDKDGTKAKAMKPTQSGVAEYLENFGGNL